MPVRELPFPIAGGLAANEVRELERVVDRPFRPVSVSAGAGAGGVVLFGLRVEATAVLLLATLEPGRRADGLDAPPVALPASTPVAAPGMRILLRIGAREAHPGGVVWLRGEEP